MTPHAKGLLITFIGGLILTIDIPLIMAGGGDVLAVMVLRSGCSMTAAFVAWLIWRQFSDNAPVLIPGRDGLIVAAIYGVAAIFFTAAVFYTSAGRLVFILALNSMFAALLTWLIMGKRPKPVTVATMVVLVGAVALIVSDGLGSGTLFGDFCALLASLGLALALTLSQKAGTDMGFAPMIGGIIPVIFGLVVFATRDVGFSVDAPIFIIINGAIVLPLAFWCLATGPKYISSAEVAMFYLLETVLTPVWVWLIFDEAVTGRTAIGGTIIIAALLAHSLWQLRAQRSKTPAIAPV